MITEQELHSWGEKDSLDRREGWETLLLDIDRRISLTATQYDMLNAHYDAISAILCEPVDPLLGDLIIFPQGSVRTRTVTRPPGREDVDVDAISYIKGGTKLAPIDYLDRLFAELDARVKTGGSVEPSKRCVVVQYADDKLPCHMDITPAQNQLGNLKDDGSGRLRVPDRPTAAWSPSNPKDFADWFDTCAQRELTLKLPDEYRVLMQKRAEAESLPSHAEITAPNGLRVAVRLMKRHRDIYVQRTGRKKTKPISVILTTLAGKAYERVALRHQRQSVAPLQLLIDVVAEMPNCFDEPLGTESYRLVNPADPQENFAEKWNDDADLMHTFFDWHKHMERSLRFGLVEFPTRARFRNEIEETFGVTAGKACDEYFSRISSHASLGLSKAATRTSENAQQTAAVLGLGDKEPSRAARPKPLDRLG